jgi:hypothetical protein
MGLLKTITDITQDTIDKQPKTLYGTVTRYYQGTCTVETDDGTLENIKCINIPQIGTACLLIPVDDEYNCIPNEIDNTTTLYALGLGKFNIDNNGDLHYELPIGVTNYFSINNNGDLIINLDNITNQRFSINDDGCVIYEE